MMYAVRIKMMPSCYYSQDLTEIDEIYIEGCGNPGFFKKSILYQYLKENPGTIKVKTWPCPDLVPAISFNRELYVRSSPNGYSHDNLLDLPRE